MNQNDPPTEHILACLSSSPSNAKIVRTAATMAKAFGGTFTALYVRTPDSDQMGKEDCRRLQQHIRMAEQAGADISTIYGDDIPQQIRRVCPHLRHYKNRTGELQCTSPPFLEWTVTD